MAKAQEIDIDANEEFAAAAAHILRVRAREVFEHSEGVLDASDIERVHAMRVATRRLRAVLELFAVCFPARAYKEVLRDVKGLADALGERRDPDVQLAALEAVRADIDPAHRPGIQTVMDRVRRQQAAGNDLLRRALEQAERSLLAQRLDELADAAVEDPA